MNREWFVGPVVVVFVVLLAVATVGIALGRVGPVADLTMALIGLGFVAGAVLSLAEVAQRLHQLVRFALADGRDGHDLATLDPGTHWVRVEAEATARDEAVTGVLDDDPAVAVSVAGAVREGFTGLPWPTTRSGASFQTTEAVPAALDRAVAGVTFAASGDRRTVGHDVRVVGGERTRLTVDDDVSTHTRETLAAHGVDVETAVKRGAVFDHHVRLREAVVPDGGTVGLFGPVTVESGTDGETRLTPAGRFTTRPLLTTAGWSAIPRHLLRRLAVLSLVTPVVAACGSVLLWLAVSSLLG